MRGLLRRAPGLGSLADAFADLARRAAALGDGEYAALSAHNSVDAALVYGRDLDVVAAELPGGSGTARRSAKTAGGASAGISSTW
ncbi:MAG: hypothetical protein IPN17_35020 [Deltaproteobacteria bacterium]|nr:hypothetical protein [Deltaproteobacteria bacterium]